jgi:hypothetical protein
MLCLVGGAAPPLYVVNWSWRHPRDLINRNDLRGARQGAPIIRATTLYSVDLWKIQTMMQTYASTAKLRGGGPNLTSGWKAMELFGITATSDRYRRLVNRPTAEILCLSDTVSTTRNSRGRTQRETGGYLAGRDQPPQSNEQLASQRHDHGLAGRTAGVCGARAEPLRQGAILLEANKAPSEFDHAAAHPRVAGSC